VTEYIPLIQSIAARFPGDDEAESEGYLVLCELTASHAQLAGPEFVKLLRESVKNRLLDRRKRQRSERRAGLAGGTGDLDALPRDLRKSLAERLSESDLPEMRIVLARWADGMSWRDLAAEYFPGQHWKTVMRQWQPMLDDIAAEVRRVTTAE
jgi:hypothetical protein